MRKDTLLLDAPPLQALREPVAEDLRIVASVFDDELAGDLPFVDALCDTVRAYRGKMLRPTLLLLAGKAAGGLTAAHHTLAAVVEMVHMATLVHDDVLDEADERRRQPTVNRIAGNTAAVLVGDYLISHAYHLCSSLESQYASRRIGATTNTVCEGELLQNHLRGRTDVDEGTYFEIIRHKTAALTATACELGAYYAGAEPLVVGALRSFGESCGIAFQIVDDVLDIVGDRDTVGKTLGRDVGLGKLTLPAIHCLEHADEETGAALRETLRRKLPSQDGCLRACLSATGSLDYALGVAGGYVQSAIEGLEPLPPSTSRNALVASAEFIIARRF